MTTMSISFENFLSDESMLQQYQQIKCPQCNEIPKDAVQIESCRHSLCRLCAETLIYSAQCSDKRMTMCPQKDCDGQLIVGTKCYSDNEDLRGEVNRFRMILIECCIGDCVWSGHIKNYKDHIMKRHPPSLMQDLPKEKATHSLTGTEELVSATRILKKETEKSIDDFAKRISLHGVANVGSSQNSLDSGIANCSNLSLEQTSQPAVFLEDRLSVLNTQINHEAHLESMPDSESDNWTQERSQMVSGSLKLPRLFPYPHKTLASHGKQLTPTQGASGQHPPMAKKEASFQTDFDNKHKIQSRRHSRIPVPKGQHHLLETTPTSKNSGNQANRKKRQAEVSLLPAIDMPTQRKRPMSTSAVNGLSSTPSLPPVRNGTSTVSPKRKPRPYTLTYGECMGKDLDRDPAGTS